MPCPPSPIHLSAHPSECPFYLVTTSGRTRLLLGKPGAVRSRCRTFELYPNLSLGRRMLPRRIRQRDIQRGDSREGVWCAHAVLCYGSVYGYACFRETPYQLSISRRAYLEYLAHRACYSSSHATDISTSLVDPLVPVCIGDILASWAHFTCALSSCLYTTPHRLDRTLVDVLSLCPSPRPPVSGQNIVSPSCTSSPETLRRHETRPLLAL